MPAPVPLTSAALAEPLAVAVHAVARAGECRGAHVAVLGAGPVGLLTAMVARGQGARSVRLIEPVPTRRRAAGSLGLEVGDTAAADVVFDAAGVPDAIGRATRITRPGGVVVVVGVHAEPAVTDLRTVTFNELTITGTRVYRPADIDRALGLLAAGMPEVAPLISDIVEPRDVPAAMQCGGAMTQWY